MDKPEKLWTLSEFADAVSRHPWTIRQWVKAGKVPAVRIGNRYFFRQSELDTWLEDLTKQRGQSNG